MKGKIDYNIKTTGGVRRVLFSGEGLFMTHMTGPGKVLLQSLKRGVMPGQGTRGR